VSIEIPEGALDHEVAISIGPLSKADFAGPSFNSVEIGPSGTEFKKPAIVRFRYDPQILQGKSPLGLRVATFDAQKRPQILPSEPQTTANVFGAATMHLSPFAFIARWGAQFLYMTKSGFKGDAGLPALMNACQNAAGETAERGHDITGGIVFTMARVCEWPDLVDTAPFLTLPSDAWYGLVGCTETLSGDGVSPDVVPWASADFALMGGVWGARGPHHHSCADPLPVACCSFAL
jgi:hypothetical protein